MKEVTLDKLNSTTFEAIVKALALEKFGPAGQVFPAGPDAGRDFAYEGSIIPYQAQGWAGYMVLQAKFKSRLSGTNDVTWLIEQLKMELAKFLRKDSQYRKPEYYIIATNINLSGADGKTKDSVRKSGMTKVAEHMKDWTDLLDLKGFDVWPAEKIETFLTASPNIRTTYLASIIPGDILNKIAESLGAGERNHEFALKISLVHLLKRDKGVRLKDAGSLTDDEIRTSQVFVDLPVRLSKNREPSYKFVAQTIEQSKGIFNSFNSEPEQSQNRIKRNKIVLLGGPGQGKSTASLFLAQLFRASLITDSKGLNLDNATLQLVSEIFDRANSESIHSTLPSRYPAWISLPQFADSISSAKANKTKKPSLLSFVADEIIETSQSSISVDSLRLWLKSFPSIFIFDGLDEVPPSGERSSVLAAIQDLVSEMEILNCDSFFIVTSRPQGYNSDFDTTEWSHRELSDLPLETAMSYAKLLANSYYKEDPYRQKKIIDQLNRSAHHVTTQRLMKSPLQVTILHMIVDTGGGVPNSRWSLFHEYFEILKKREKSKGGEIQRTLDKNLNQVGPIHQRTGLILHIDAEMAGSATASLDLEKLSLLIKNYLKSEGFDTNETNDRLTELTELALHRLVLLSSREEGKISFDVRSLQEFMAAAALTASSPDVIEERLLLIAGKSHWQHVFTIAASRCFSEDNLFYLRSVVTQLPKRLEDSPYHKVAGNGALLSYALFSDDIAADHPTYRRMLALHALEILFHGFDHEPDLQILIEPHTETAIYEDLKKIYLLHSDDTVRAAAWDLILQQAELGSSLALDVLHKCWPRDPSEAYKLIKNGVYPAFDENFHHAILQSVLTTPFSKVIDEGNRFITSIKEHALRTQEEVKNEHVKKDTYNIFKTFKALVVEYSLASASEVQHKNSSIQIKFNKINCLSEVAIPETDHDLDPEWTFIFSCVRFSKNPNTTTLKEALKNFRQTSVCRDSNNSIFDQIPWIVSASIKSENYMGIDYEDHLPDTFGNETIWLKTENRVESSGFELTDFDRFGNDPDKPQTSISAFIRECSFLLNTGATESEEAIGHYLNTYKSAPNPGRQYIMGRFIQLEAMMLRKLNKLPQDSILDMLNILKETIAGKDPGEAFIYHEILTSIEDFDLPEHHISLLAELSPNLRMEFTDTHFNDIETSPNFHLLCSHLDVDKGKKGLVVLICMLRILHKTSKDTLQPSLLEALSSDDNESIAYSSYTLLFLDKEIDATNYLENVSTIIIGKRFSHFFNLSLQLLENKNLSTEIKIELATKLTEIYQSINHPDSFRFKIRLKSLLDSQLSGLGNESTWKAMALPNDAFITSTL
ncbi:hypothetical protein [Pseudomonas viridiflava]|uniref:NACHT domain-containing protein n=1 Tax=Pseudomonas viridiflava TaxID=33069 RepID=UPI002EC738EA|nr:hypothetical protein [Pseudomonas viridiflava]